MVRALLKLAASPGDWPLLVRAQAALLRARRRVRDQPQGSLVADLCTGPARGGATPPPRTPAARTAIVERAGLAIDRVARFGLGRPLCLVRAIALHDLLVKQGVDDARIRVGVRTTASGRFAAHAWVEWAGQAVGENPEDVRRYDPISDLEKAARASWSSP